MVSNLQDTVVDASVLLLPVAAAKALLPNFSCFRITSKRDGLAEHLFLRYLSYFVTLKLTWKPVENLGANQGGASEVNRKSVIATQRLGRSVLEKLCNTMNLPPPVNKNSHFSFKNLNYQVFKKFYFNLFSYLKSINNEYVTDIFT